MLMFKQKPTLDSKKAARLTPNEVRPNSGAPAVAPALQWVVHQSALPWVNSVTLWPLGSK